MGKWVTYYIRDVSKFSSRIAAYQDKNTERELLPLLFAFNLQNYSRCMTYHHFELQVLKHKNVSAYEQLKTYRMEVSLNRRKFLTIPGDIVTYVPVYWEVWISFWIHGEISTVNGEHFIADIIIMSTTRKFARGDKKNYSNEEKLALSELVEKYKKENFGSFGKSLQWIGDWKTIQLKKST